MLTPRLTALAVFATLSFPAQAQENVVQTFQSVFVNGLICFTSNGCMLVKNVPAVLFSKELKDKDDQKKMLEKVFKNAMTVGDLELEIRTSGKQRNARAGGRNWTLRGGDSYTELGGERQHCEFDKGLYINPGPWRIPYHHENLLHYCRELGVALEPFVQVNYNAYMPSGWSSNSANRRSRDPLRPGRCSPKSRRRRSRRWRRRSASARKTWRPATRRAARTRSAS